MSLNSADLANIQTLIQQAQQQINQEQSKITLLENKTDSNNLQAAMESISKNYSDKEIANAQAIMQQNMEKMAGTDSTGLNGMYAAVTNMITRTPEQNRQIETDKLRKIWQTAKVTQETAPNTTATAERNYYEFANGPLAYDNMLMKRYTTQAREKLQQSKKTHNELVDKLNILINDYAAEKNTESRMQELLKIRLSENKELKNAIDTDVGQVETNDRKVVYENWAKDWLDDVGKALLYIYVVLAIWYFIISGFFQKALYKTVKGWGIPLGLILFPFCVKWISLFIVMLYNNLTWFINNKAPKDVFINV